uniref:Uncharacterized protein n=1 Tax=Heliothis virescens TaxID=7102 RepID=A0A2A4IVP4_HELVI
MSYIDVLLVCCIALELSCCGYVAYPSGVQVWLQRADVIEVDEDGQEVLHYASGDLEMPDFDISTPNGYDVTPENSIADAAYCPDGVRVGDKCVKKD